jgi:hypothetical protein
MYNTQFVYSGHSARPLKRLGAPTPDRRYYIPSPPMPSRPFGLSLALMFVTVAAGLTIRFVPLGLPPFVVKYGGSTLWALMLYWIVSALLPSWRVLANALLASVLATAVEFVKLYHSSMLDAFRLTLPGIVLLGRYFSVWDIVAYWIAISFGAFVDQGIRQVRKRHQARRFPLNV